MSPDYTEYLKVKPKKPSKLNDIVLYGTIAGGIAVTVLLLLFVIMPYLNRVPTAREVLTSAYNNLRNTKNLDVVYNMEFSSEISGAATNINGTATYSKKNAETWNRDIFTGFIDEHERFISNEEFTSVMSIILGSEKLPLEENTGDLFMLRPCTALRFWLPAVEYSEYFDLYFDNSKFSETDNMVVFMCLDKTSGVPLMAFYSIQTTDAESISVMYLANEYTLIQ